MAMNRSDRDYLQREISFWGLVIVSLLSTGLVATVAFVGAIFMMVLNWNK